MDSASKKAKKNEEKKLKKYDKDMDMMIKL